MTAIVALVMDTVKEKNKDEEEFQTDQNFSCKIWRQFSRTIMLISVKMVKETDKKKVRNSVSNFLPEERKFAKTHDYK